MLEHLGVEVIPVAQCWRLIETHGRGRLAYAVTGASPDVHPVIYLVHEGAIYLCWAAGGKARTVARDLLTAVEIDGTDDRFHWSVLVRVGGERLESENEIEPSGILASQTGSATPRPHFLRLTPTEVAGRRFPRRAPRAPYRDGYEAVAPPFSESRTISTGQRAC